MRRSTINVPGVATICLAVASAALSLQAADEAELSAAGIKFFESRVKPLLEKNCFECHGGDKEIKGGLRLTSRTGLLRGGETGAAVSLENPAESLLLKVINYDGYEMPPTGKLPPEAIDILTKWVMSRLPWTPGEEVEEVSDGARRSPEVNEETKKFWSFQPVTRPAVPAVENSEWVRSPIDAFVLRGLEEAGLRPSAAAEKTALLRRAYYDLTGLPPEPAEVEAFLADTSPAAFEKVVDRLLDSPHYGERWARHWLDLVRYAESNSYERDGAKPFVWRYRDYVIRSLNDDKPYDQFILEQLAGDELDEVTTDSIIATGYYRLGTWQDEPVDAEQELFEDLDDIVKTTAEVFMGLTVGCARCHDHKLDPIPQKDYYRLVAFFRNVRRYGQRSGESVTAASLRSIAGEEATTQYQKLAREHRTAVRENNRAVRVLERKIRADIKGVEKDDWRDESARIEIARRRIGGLLTQDEFDRYVEDFGRRNRLRRSRPPGLEQALSVKERGRESPPTYVLVRGNAHVRGDEVQPGFPTVLGQPEPEIVPPPSDIASTGRRLALARWFASPENPLTARVMVNRIWQYHFGRGIVRSSSDFGFQGIRPTHPQLLDWLASELVAGDWHLKRLHKLIMLSSTYRMSSRADAKALAADPTNDLFWRYNMRRLSAEEIRDSILAVNGSLNREKMFGPSIYPIIPPEVLAGQSRPGSGWRTSSAEDRARRSIYIHIKRSLVVPIIASFDGADTDATCPVRFVTTQPTQALGMLNSKFVNDQADLFAGYVREHAGETEQARVEVALGRALQRRPQEREIELGLELLTKLQEDFGLSSDDALKQFCVTVLNLNEFLYLD